MKTTNKPKQIEYEHVELILREANAHGLHWEVDTHAKMLINKKPEINIVEAYQMAYEEWVK
jgi:hypothetical protein